MIAMTVIDNLTISAWRRNRDHKLGGSQTGEVISLLMRANTHYPGITGSSGPIMNIHFADKLYNIL